MKRANFLYLLLVFCIPFTNAQKGESGEQFQINVFIPEQDFPIPQTCITLLQSKLKQQLISSNIITGEGFSRFLLVPKIAIEKQTVTATVPAQIVESFRFQLFIGDGLEGKMFASYYTTVAGVGVNENASLTDAINNLDLETTEFTNFVKSGKQKSVTYYSQNCQQIINKSNQLSTLKHYEEALFTLSTIPTECIECWKIANNQLRTTFKQSIDFNGKILLSQAKGIWSASQDSTSAMESAELLSKIDPESSSYGEANQLFEIISESVKGDKDKMWKYKMELPLKLENDKLNAMKEVGIAWGQNQPQSVTYKSFW